MKLYSYFRSSASYRVRIALNLKGLPYDIVPVNLLKSQQKSAEYAAVNPQQLVPALIDNGQVLTQSLAVIEYLDEKYPTIPLLPVAPLERARVRALALAVACEIAPLNNLGPLNFLKELGLTDEQKTRWYHHWLAKGFKAVEEMLQNDATGTYCHGAAPTMADCVLVPQVFNAQRFNCDLSPYPTLMRIHAACEKHPAFIAAHPSQQPDAV
jgi:maleylpyruvate isomerase